MHYTHSRQASSIVPPLFACPTYQPAGMRHALGRLLQVDRRKGNVLAKRRLLLGPAPNPVSSPVEPTYESWSWWWWWERPAMLPLPPFWVHGLQPPQVSRPPQTTSPTYHDHDQHERGRVRVRVSVSVLHWQPIISVLIDSSTVLLGDWPSPDNYYRHHHHHLLPPRPRPRPRPK